MREGVKKTVFLGDFSQMWVGGVAESQTKSKPLKKQINHPENLLFRPEFRHSFSHPGVGGWINRGEISPKKRFFFRRLP